MTTQLGAKRAAGDPSPVNTALSKKAEKCLQPWDSEPLPPLAEGETSHVPIFFCSEMKQFPFNDTGATLCVGKGVLVGWSLLAGLAQPIERWSAFKNGLLALSITVKSSHRIGGIPSVAGRGRQVRTVWTGLSRGPLGPFRGQQPETIRTAATAWRCAKVRRGCRDRRSLQGGDAQGFTS